MVGDHTAVRLLLIRHAESANNASWTGDAAAFFRLRSADPDLTERGREQATRLAAHLEHVGDEPHELITSPLLRALQTTAPISSALQFPSRVWVDVHELGGVFTGDPGEPASIRPQPGLSRAAIEAEVPGIDASSVPVDGWWNGTHEGEAERLDRVARVADALRLKARAFPDQRVMIVTHGGFASRLIAALVGVSPTTWFNLANTSCSEFELLDDQVRVLSLNDTRHLHGIRALPAYRLT